MPYARNDQLPAPVKAALPARVQTIWRSAYNDAAAKGWDEGRCASYAWGAVKKAGWKKPAEGERWVKMMDTFLSDLQKFKLEYEERGDRCAVKGLPVLRVGKWKGMDYDRERLVELVETFEAIKTADDWLPPVRPRHPSQEERENDTWDTTQNLGVVEALQFDEDTDALLATIEVDADTFAKMRGGNVRYTSSEFGTYHSPNTEAAYDEILSGMAFVDNPAVKNTQWAFAMNAAEFTNISALGMGDLSASQLQEKLREEAEALPEYPSGDGLNIGGPWIREVFEDSIIIGYEGDTYQHSYSVVGTVVALGKERLNVKQAWLPVLPPPATTSATVAGTLTSHKGGGSMMNLFDKVKDWILPDKREEFEALKAEDDAVIAEDTLGAATEASPKLVEQLAAVTKRADEAGQKAEKMEKQLAAEVAKRKDGERQRRLDALSKDGVIIPAARALFETVFRQLEATDAKPIVLKSKDGDVEFGPTELLVEALKANASVQERYFTSEVQMAQSGDKNAWEGYEREDAKEKE